MPSNKKFSSFLFDTRFDDLPQDVIRQAKTCLYDLLGTAAGGGTLPAASLIRRHAEQFFGTAGAGARMMFDGRLASAAGAALAGGMTIDGLDCHDGQALTKGHVGCAVLPSILAYYDSEPQSRGGRDLLTDLVIGYEIGTRMAIALHATVADYHTSGAWNAVTCAALGARILGCDPETARHAMGIAEYHGPRSQMMRVIDHPSMLKDGSGWGAMAGVSAAYLAKEGFTGAPAILVEEEATAAYWADLGERWFILEQYFKPYPVCRWAQPSITAGLKLKADHGFDCRDIEAVTATTFHQGRRLFQGVPENTEQAQYGIVFPLAAALKHGTIGSAEISGDGLSDGDVLALSSRITIEESEDYNIRFPAERWAHVEIRLKDGSILVSEPTKADGDPDTPLGEEALQDKFRRLARPVLGEVRTEELLRIVIDLDAVESSANNLMDRILAPVG